MVEVIRIYLRLVVRGLTRFTDFEGLRHHGNFHERIQAHSGNRGADCDINRCHGNRCSGERYGRARREVASAKRQRTGCWAWRHDSEHDQSAWSQ